MAVDYALSAKAPPLHINLDADMMHGLARYCERYGGRPMTQGGLKCLQAIPIVNASLAVKESAKMSVPARNLAMSKCYQEISAPGWIKVLEKAETMSLGFLHGLQGPAVLHNARGMCVCVCVSLSNNAA